MATSTFERKIEIKSEDSIKKLMRVIETDAPTKTISKPPYSAKERDRSEALLKQYLSH